MNLAQSLSNNWEPHRVTVSCSECQGELLDTKKSRPVVWEPSYLSKLIKTYAKEHKEREGHSELDVDIYKNPEPVETIDCNITVKND